MSSEKCAHCIPYQVRDISRKQGDQPEIWFLQCPKCYYLVHFSCFLYFFREGGHRCTKCGYLSSEGGGDFKIVSGAKKSWFKNLSLPLTTGASFPFGQTQSQSLGADLKSKTVLNFNCECCKILKRPPAPHFLSSIKFIGQKSKEDELVKLNKCGHGYHLSCLKSHLLSYKASCLQCGVLIEQDEWTNFKPDLKMAPLSPAELCEKIYDPFYCRLCPLYRKPKMVPQDISKNWEDGMMDGLFPWVKLNDCDHFYHETCLQFYLMDERTQCIACNSKIDLGQCKPYPRTQLKLKGQQEQASTQSSLDGDMGSAVGDKIKIT